MFHSIVNEEHPGISIDFTPVYNGESYRRRRVAADCECDREECVIAGVRRKGDGLSRLRSDSCAASRMRGLGECTTLFQFWGRSRQRERSPVRNFRPAFGRTTSAAGP